MKTLIKMQRQMKMKTKVAEPPRIRYVLPSVHVYFLFLPESQNREMFLVRIAEIILRNYTVLARLIAECLEIKLVSAVN